MNNIENKIVIDYGCGSGILALAALKLNAKKALGIDVDAEPVATPPVPAEEPTVEPEQAPEPTAASDDSPPESATAQEPEAAASPEPPTSETEVDAPIELPDGYYPPNNRVADLLSSFRGN